MLGAALAELAEAEEWADRLAYAIAPVSVIGEHSSANNPWMNALEIVGQRESSIRADYEELVKALLRHEYVQSWLINFKTRGVDGLKDAMEREYDDPDSMVAAFGAALTRIEESLGGRS